MILFSLFSNNPILIVPWLAALLIAITIHEFAHGFAAYKLGDDTAYREGRLTLNPIDHIDPFGALMLLLVGFGWAKPVPINIYKVGKGRLGMIIVSFAGVFVNLMFALFILLSLKFFILGNFPYNNLMVTFFGFLVYINLALFTFNLLPIPPLDGYHIVEYFFPKFFLKVAPFIGRWGSILLLVIVFGTNIIGTLISFVVISISVLFNIDIFFLAFGSL